MLQISNGRLKHLANYAVHHSIVLPLAAVFGIIVLLISPVGEFPLNDDWIYTKTVQHLVNTGQYQAHPYLNATLVAQAYWGALFCKLFGFSFTTLRCSTLVLSCIHGWGIARCGLAIGLSRPLALLSATMVMTNPIILGLSYSFMTDIPFLTLSTLSGLFFLKALRKLSTSLIFLGSLLGGAAFFVRQFGLIVPLAFALTLAILHYRQDVRVTVKTWLSLIAPLMSVLTVYLMLSSVLSSDTPILEPIGNRLWMIMIEAIRYLPISLSYGGLFLMPLGIVRFWQIVKKRMWSRQEWLIFNSFCTSSLFIFALPHVLYGLGKAAGHHKADWLLMYPYRMPLLPLGMLLDFGLGHVQLLNPIPRPELQIGEWWWLITIPSLGVGGLLCVMAWKQPWISKTEPKSQTANPQVLFLWMWGGLGLLSVYNPWRLIVTDRYLLIAFVPLTLLMAAELKRSAHRWTIKWLTVGIGLVLSVSLMLTQDYMAWNTAASAAQQRLMTTYRVSPALIAGTDPLNGWYNSAAYMKRHNTRSWWDLNMSGKGAWVLDNQYVIASVEPLIGYEVIERFPYFSWLGWQERAILIFRRR